jgi:acetylornithine deacetylase
MKTKLNEKVLKNIEKNKSMVVDFLKDLIKFQSVTGNEKQIQEFIAKTLKDMNLDVDVWEPNLDELSKHPAYVPVTMGYKDRPNVVGVYRGKENNRSLLLNGHVDVIPPGPLESWRYDPWGGEEEQGKIYGRGASDMKSGLAAMTMALWFILESDIELKGKVIMEYTVDEELSGNGTLACILRGYKADAGICCETSSLHVQPASIGRIWFEIIVHGKPAGIQRRWEGVNAIVKGYKILEAISDLEEIRINEVTHPLYPNNKEALPCIVGVFQGGSFPSAFPDLCVLKGSIATLPSEDSNKVKQQFIEHVLKAAEIDPWLRKHPPEIKFKGYFADPSEIPIDHPIVKTVCKNFKQITNSEPKITGRMGAADTRFLNTYGNTPTVIFGPGLTEQMHATNEWVRIEDVITATKVIALTILDWCG